MAAAVRLGYCPFDRDITVKLIGGNMVIHQGPSGIIMTGDAQKDFEGVVEI